MLIRELFESIQPSFFSLGGERGVYFHGTSSKVDIGDRLLPPDMTGVLSEMGRKKNLNKVFFTKDEGSAMIYARRAVRQFGGAPVIYRVYPVGQVALINPDEGTSVYMADWAYAERAKKSA